MRKEYIILISLTGSTASKSIKDGSVAFRILNTMVALFQQYLRHNCYKDNVSSIMKAFDRRWYKSVIAVHKNLVLLRQYVL